MKKYLKSMIDFLESNDWSNEEEKFMGLQYDIVNEMEADRVGFEITLDILELMEKNPLVEFGSPGPLTHFIEKFYVDHKEEYQKMLKNSVGEKPTVHTVWLLNRVINGTEGEIKTGLTQLMKSVEKDENLNEKIRELAKDFLD